MDIFQYEGKHWCSSGCVARFAAAPAVNRGRDADASGTLPHRCLPPAAHWPTRALQQEEEEQAQATAEAYLAEPDVTVCLAAGGAEAMHRTRLR